MDSRLITCRGGMARAVGTLAVVVALAGCSSGASPSPSAASSAAPSAASAAPSTAASPSASAPAAQDLSAFQALVDKAKQPWTEWQGPTTPVTPPTNINLALVTCAGTVNGCVDPAKEAAAAAQSLGWKTTMYDGKGDPITQGRVVLQAVNSGANAILLAGVDPTVIQAALQAAAAKGIPVGDMTQGIAPGDGLAFDVGANYVVAGNVAGAWIVTDSKGTATVLPTSDKEFKSTEALINGAISTVQQCTGCTLLPTEYFVATDIGKGLGQRIVQDLQRDPSVNYVIGAFDPAVADMVPAIVNAGIGDRIRLISNVGDSQNIDFIRKGTVQQADIVFDNTYVGYAAVDQMIRVLTKQPLWKNNETDPRFVYNETVPYHLLVQDNLGADNSPWHQSVDTVAMFSKLWGLTK